MPFTISHAAAVLPLRKLTKAQLPLAALMIGSMSPDFAYFVPGDPDRVFTHSIAGIFWFCWPVGLAAWLLFVRVLELPTLALLPDGWRARFVASYRELTLATLALASAAVIAGAMTHLLWDSFTHRGTWAVAKFPALNEVAFYYHGWGVRWFEALQHASSIIGMSILAIWAFRLAPTDNTAPPLPPVSPATRRWAVVILVSASSTLAIASFLLHSDTWFIRRLFHFAIGGMTGWVLAWLAVAIYVGRTATVPIRRA